MIIIGLTGSIGMGKSTAAKIMCGFGWPVYDADKAVHGLMRKGGAAVKPVAKLFPDCLKDQSIDRKALGRSVFGYPAKLRKLEKILHPLVRLEEKKFLAAALKRKAQAVVLEIPLLFETGGERRCDITICVTAPKAVQLERVLQRKHMSKARLQAILNQQMPDSEKRQRADFVVQTGKGLADTKRQLQKIRKGLQIDA